MRVVIDMQGAQTESRFRGIGRYSLSIAQAVARNAGSHDIWLVLNAKLPESIGAIREAFHSLIPFERIRIFDVPALEDVQSWNNLAAEIIRESFLESLEPDVVLLTSVFEGHWSNAVTSIGAHISGQRTAAILYDLIPLIHAEKYLTDSGLRAYYDRKLASMKKAGVVLAISESSRQEGMQYLSMGADKVVNISTATDVQFKPANQSAEGVQSLRARLGIHRCMVLYAPGGFDERKNFVKLVAAYSQLPQELRSKHQLVIVSKLSPVQHNELLRLAKTHRLQADELVLTGYVTDEDLIALYSLAQLFVFPSLHEGFGLPALEAMACGAPVIGSGTTSLPEVIGLQEALFDPDSVESITLTMERGLNDSVFRQRLLAHGQAHVRTFNWDNCAKRALLAMEKLHQQNPSIEEPPPLLVSLAKISMGHNTTDEGLRDAAKAIAFNQGAPRRQLLLDISTLVRCDARSGIQRVVRSLTIELFRQCRDHLDVQPIYYDDGFYRYANAFSAEAFEQITGVGDAVADFFQDDIYLSLDLNMHLSAKTHPYHQALRSRGLRVAYIVYDILLAQKPHWWTSDNATSFKIWLRHIGEVASDLVCISQAVADEVAEWYRINPPNRQEAGPELRHFHLGADLENSLPSTGMPRSAQQIWATMKQRLSFLMVSTIEPRKGHAQTLAAFDILWAKGLDLNLVIVGKRGWLVDELIARLSSHPETARRLIWLEGISDEYLGTIYQNADCLITASEGEGFGLPLIEAAQHALPLIARDLPVFREVASDHAYYFTGNAPSDLADAIENWMALHSTGQHPTTTGMKWVTWKESAEQLIKTMEFN